MLTRELAIAECDFVRGQLLPDRLRAQTHQQYLQHARRMLAVYRGGEGRTRRDLHRAVGRVFADEPDCPQRRIDAFCKLLDDVSVYDRDTKGQAAQLRQRVFQLAASRHPLVSRADQLFEQSEADTKKWIAAELGRSWTEIERELFADVIEFHRLRRFEGFADERDLLSRYNVAQTQAALYDAELMTVWATADFKTILRYAKLARLMHSIVRASDGYQIRLDGPASIMRGTRRYGAAMARFLPALIACRNWRLHAQIRRGRRGALFALRL